MTRYRRSGISGQNFPRTTGTPGIDIEFPPGRGLLDRDVDSDAGAVVARVGQGGQPGRGPR
jgi:hypothetical protein